MHSASEVKIKRTKATFLLSSDLAARLKKAAAKAGVPQGTIVESALRSVLAKRASGKPGIAIRAELEKGPAAALAVATHHRRHHTLHEIAATLNRKGYRTKQGKEWSVVSVSRLLSK